MHICHIITKPELGGAQLSTLEIVSRLAEKEGYNISLVTGSRGTLLKDFKDLKGVKVYLVPFLVRNISPIYDILAFIYILFLYLFNKYDIVHTHSSKAGILGRWAAFFARIPVIIHTVHGWSFNSHQLYITKIFYRYLERLTAKFTSIVICVSRNDINKALRYRIADKKKLVFIKYGIDIEKFSSKSNEAERLNKRKEIGMLDKGPVVGMIACLKPQKSPLDYVRACIEVHKKIPEANFLLVGDGVLRKDCRRIIQNSSLDGRFVFAGWRRDIAGILDLLDVAVLTSKWEGMPISIIEALLKGCPVVATDSGSTNEIVKDGVSGYIVNVGDFQGISEKVVNLLSNKELHLKMRQAAARSIDASFSKKRMADEIEALYRRFNLLMLTSLHRQG